MLIYKDCIEESEGLQYTCDPCEITEGGGVRSLCLLKKGTTIPNPYTQLDIDILVGAGLMHVMAETRGSFDGGTPKMITGYGDNKERNIGSDYVLMVKDPIFADNYAFWEAVEKIEDWNIAFRTETQLAVVYDDVTITTKAPAEEGIDTEVVWDIECKWFSKNKPTIQPYSGKFDTILKTLDVVYGGTIATGGAVKLFVDADKTGYVKLPNGNILTTVAGTINITYTGIGGAITYYVPKNTPFPSIEESGIAGDIFFNGENEFVAFNNVNITGITADKVSGITTSNNTNMSYLHCSMAEDILIYNCDALVSFDAPNADMIGATNSENLANMTAPKAVTLQCSNCALTAKSIGDILYQAYIDERENVAYNFSGGTNAAYDDVKTYIFNTYGITGQTVVDALDVTGEILFNE